MFNEIKEELTRKICELRLWLSNINDSDDFSAINKGLFYVYIYGIYEETVRTVVQKTIEELNAKSVKIDECIYELYALIFSAEYDSIYGVGNEHKWEKRWNISDKLTRNPIVSIPNEIVPTDGKNLRYRQLESIAKSFGIHNAILPRAEIGGNIQEMVDNRNYIAHGNKTPKEVGREVSVNDLQRKLDHISEAYIKVMNEIGGRYINLFHATTDFQVNNELQFGVQDYGGFIKSPVGNVYSDKFVLMSILCQINFLLYGIEKWINNEIPTKLRFGYLLYYSLISVIEQINQKLGIALKINSKWKSDRFRNSMAHYKLGIVLKESNLIISDAMFGLTEKIFGEDYYTIKKSIYKELEKLAKQIGAYLDLPQRMVYLQ